MQVHIWPLDVLVDLAVVKAAACPADPTLTPYLWLCSPLTTQPPVVVWIRDARDARTATIRALATPILWIIQRPPVERSRLVLPELLRRQPVLTGERKIMLIRYHRLSLNEEVWVCCNEWGLGKSGNSFYVQRARGFLPGRAHAEGLVLTLPWTTYYLPPTVTLFSTHTLEVG